MLKEGKNTFTNNKKLNIIFLFMVLAINNNKNYKYYNQVYIYLEKTLKFNFFND